MPSKLNNVLISSKQRSPAPLENNDVFNDAKFEGSPATSSQEAEGVRAASFSAVLLAMNRAAHRSPAWASSHCWPRATCAGTHSVDTVLCPLSLPWISPLQPPAATHITATAFGAAPHHLSIHPQVPPALVVCHNVRCFPGCLSGWNHDYIPSKMAGFVTAASRSNINIPKV